VLTVSYLPFLFNAFFFFNICLLFILSHSGTT
jgi:hypothetical protein